VLAEGWDLDDAAAGVEAGVLEALSQLQLESVFVRLVEEAGQS
jgi:hypothetical protein